MPYTGSPIENVAQIASLIIDAQQREKDRQAQAQQGQLDRQERTRFGREQIAQQNATLAGQMERWGTPSASSVTAAQGRIAAAQISKKPLWEERFKNIFGRDPTQEEFMRESTKRASEAKITFKPTQTYKGTDGQLHTVREASDGSVSIDGVEGSYIPPGWLKLTDEQMKIEYGKSLSGSGEGEGIYSKLDRTLGGWLPGGPVGPGEKKAPPQRNATLTLPVDPEYVGKMIEGPDGTRYIGVPK